MKGLGLAVGLLCLSVACGQLNVPDSLRKLTEPSNVLDVRPGNSTNGTKAAEDNPIAERQETAEQATYPYHIEVKTIEYLLDQISGKIKAQHDKIMDQHKKNQARVKEAARTKVSAAQTILDKADLQDKAKLELLRAARAKLEEAQLAVETANTTRTKSMAAVSGATAGLDSVKKEAEAEVKEATRSNEEQTNEALEILGNEQKLVQTVRFMLKDIHKKSAAPEKPKAKSDIEKEMLSKQIDVVANAAASTGEAKDAATAGAANTKAAIGRPRFLR